MLSDLKTEIEKVVRPILTDQSFDLVEIKLSRYRKNYRLQVFIDSDSGVKLNDCARVSGLVGTALDMTDLMDDGYVLEISSPGVDRPFGSEVDFRRRIGRNVRINLIADGCEKTIQGVLTEVNNEALMLSGKEGTIEVALANIRQGREII
jgi:ribosome maturation factor RimP